MGLILHKKLAEDSIIGFWKITEDMEEVMNSIHLSEKEIEAMQNFRNERRRQQWLCTRALLASISDSDKKITYNENGKPFLLDASNNISISHSNDMVGIILSKNQQVGIDLEHICGRVEKIESRFLSEQERMEIGTEDRMNKLYAYWCAKEALYKVFGENEIQFDSNIRVEPFNFEKAGKFEGSITKNERTEKYNLEYFTLQDYMVVWTLK